VYPLNIPCPSTTIQHHCFTRGLECHQQSLQTGISNQVFIRVSKDWLNIHGFTSCSRIFSLKWRRHHCRWRAAKFRPMFGAQGLWAGRDLYRVTPAVTRDLGFSGLIQKTTPFSRLLRHTRVCESILTRILTWWVSTEENIKMVVKINICKGTTHFKFYVQV
jgi:hypothetical protein